MQRSLFHGHMNDIEMKIDNNQRDEREILNQIRIIIERNVGLYNKKDEYISQEKVK